MAAASARYWISPSVIHETIDEETVIIDCARGLYYSLERAGAQIWSWLEAGASQAELVGLLAARYSGARRDFSAAVRNLLSTLQEEGLVIRDDRERPGPIPSIGAALVAPPETARVPFAKPALEKYLELEGIILASALHVTQFIEGPTAIRAAVR